MQFYSPRHKRICEKFSFIVGYGNCAAYVVVHSSASLHSWLVPVLEAMYPSGDGKHIQVGAYGQLISTLLKTRKTSSRKLLKGKEEMATIHQTFIMLENNLSCSVLLALL